MAEKKGKKKIKVQDLKPKTDAKGGARGNVITGSGNYQTGSGNRQTGSGNYQTSGGN